ncbi:S-adenosyl-L-methionine-dependent methyltransferase [Xylariales sp. PMI_506]|nr:S-adenosyl-L-methionine-dependent methyltransferase [Xylariales sp. PMI_506]
MGASMALIQQGYASSPSASRPKVQQSDLPEPDRPNNTDDDASKDLSLMYASLPVPDLEVDEAAAIMEPDEGVDMDGVSSYAVTHYPPNPIKQNPARPMDDSATFHSNRSIIPTDVEFQWENGRRYCGLYFMPNDDQEQTRLLLVHEVFKSAFDHEPTTVPLQNPTSILDVGAGTGEWAMDMADRYDSCEITGVDIANNFPKYTPPNLFWEIDNAEWEWERPLNSYDLVHFRYMAGAFSDWPFIYQQAFKVIKPGGWIEIVDFDALKGLQNFISFFGDDSPIHKLVVDFTAASVASNRPLGERYLEPQLLIDAGFTEVKVTEHQLPVSPKEMSSGHLFLKALVEGIEATTLRLLTTYKGWTAEEVRTACAIISQEMKDIAMNKKRERKFVSGAKVLVGRKPAIASWWDVKPKSESDHCALDAEARRLQRHKPHFDRSIAKDFSPVAWTTPTSNSPSRATGLQPGQMASIEVSNERSELLEEAAELVVIPSDSPRHREDSRRRYRRLGSEPPWASIPPDELPGSRRLST